MSTKLWFLQDLEDIMKENEENFGMGKNSWYNKLFASVHIFFAGKYLERESILQEMQIIYESENTKNQDETTIGFVLPSKKQKEGTLEFGLIKKENVLKMRPIREKNQKLNEQLIILQDFMGFLYSIDPRSEIFEEQYFSKLKGLFEQWWEEQMTLRAKALEDLKKTQTQSLTFDGNGEVPASQRSDT